MINFMRDQRNSLRTKSAQQFSGSAPILMSALMASCARDYDGVGGWARGGVGERERRGRDGTGGNSFRDDKIAPPIGDYSPAPPGTWLASVGSSWSRRYESRRVPAHRWSSRARTRRPACGPGRFGWEGGREGGSEFRGTRRSREYFFFGIFEKGHELEVHENIIMRSGYGRDITRITRTSSSMASAAVGGCLGRCGREGAKKVDPRCSVLCGTGCDQNTRIYHSRWFID